MPQAERPAQPAVPNEWRARPDPEAALAYAVPHVVVSQMLRPLIAARLPPSSVTMLTSHDAQRCITALKFHTSSATGFDPSHFDFPAQLLFLTSLSIGWHGRGFDLRGNGDGVGRLVHLQELALIQCAGVNADFFEALRNLRELRTLTLDDCSDLDAAGFAHLSGLPELSHVSLLRSSIGASHCETLSTLPKLQVLSLDCAGDVDVVGIRNIALIPNLHYLDLGFTRLDPSSALDQAFRALTVEVRGGNTGLFD